MRKPYTFITDPGHGWLAVPKAELVSLGIAQDISSCSYQHNGTAYLEEDDDMIKFCVAKGWYTYQASEPFIQEEHQENTPIRTYQPFTP